MPVAVSQNKPVTNSKPWELHFFVGNYQLVIKCSGFLVVTTFSSSFREKKFTIKNCERLVNRFLQRTLYSTRRESIDALSTDSALVTVTLLHATDMNLAFMHNILCT